MSPISSRTTTTPSLPVPLVLTAALLGLGGCGDGSVGGGGAGDDDLGGGDVFTPSPIEPFVGVWNIAGSWNGVISDQAFMEIRPVDADGRAAVRIHEFDEQNGCYFRPVGAGRVELDDAFRDRIFMNNVIPFDDAELSLSGGTLGIRYFDTFDVDGDGDAGEVLSFDAPSASTGDIAPSC